MGATTFAFLPARHVLIAEGNSDAMLYPTLFREATGEEDLRFQVVPGLANISADQIPRLMSEGGTVAFIVDGDEAGEKYRDELLAAGVAKSLVFSLGKIFKKPLELEDLIDPNHYASAVNVLLSTFQSQANEYGRQEIPLVGRIDALEAWCKERQVDAPDKTRVAQVLLDKKSAHANRAEDLQLLAGSRRKRLAELVSQIKSALGTSHYEPRPINRTR